MPKPTRHGVTVLALAVAAASGLWFVARDAQPVVPIDKLKAMLRPYAAVTVFPEAVAAPSEKPLPYVDYRGQLALAGTRPHALAVYTVTIAWRANEPTIELDGARHPLIQARQQGDELSFLVPDLFGRKGDWQFRLRIAQHALAGTVTAPDDPLMGGYLYASQAVTGKVIPPPPIVKPAKPRRS